VIQVAPEVREALDSGRAVVALETTLVAHGFPAGEGLDVALEAERRVRGAGAVPATVGVLDGRVLSSRLPPRTVCTRPASKSARSRSSRSLSTCRRRVLACHSRLLR
jgi:pseudouridine-5'-phosphate glycosidase